jgi:hypothetical protein
VERETSSRSPSYAVGEPAGSATGGPRHDRIHAAMGKTATTVGQCPLRSTPGQLALRSILASVTPTDRELGLDEPAGDNLKLAYWQLVPALVRKRYKIAADIKRTIGKLLKHLPKDSPDYGYVFWNPKTREVWGRAGRR